MFRENWDTKCDNIYEHYGDRVFVTGHVPVQRIMPDLYLQGNSLPLPIRVGNMINIDGGLAFGHMNVPNAAIFFRLDDNQFFSVSI